MERRVATLEAATAKVQETLNSMQVTLARMEEKLASKDDVHSLGIRTAVLEERTTKLATTRGVGTMITLATAVVALVANWQHIFAYFRPH